MSAPQLKRSLNLPLLTLYGLGTILGAGVYVLVGKVAGITGIYAPIAFLVAAVIAAFTGFAYASLSKRFPRSAGEVVYINQAFAKPWLGRAIGWLVVVTGVVSSATLINGFAGYLSVFITLPKLIAVTLTSIAIVAVACWGIVESVSIAAIVTTIELAGILIVLALLGDVLLTLPDIGTTLIPPLPKDLGEFTTWQSIMLGAFLAFYAFIGFEDMVNVAEEVKNPERNLPLGILAALAMASLLYVLVALVAVLSLPAESLGASESPMVSLVATKSAGAANLIGMISLVAIINGALVQVIMGSRIIYGMASQQLAPAALAHIATKTQTPVKATVLLGVIIWLFAVWLPLVTLAKITSFVIIIVFSLVNFSLAMIYWRETGSSRIKALIPLFGGALCLFLLALQSIDVFS